MRAKTVSANDLSGEMRQIATINVRRSHGHAATVKVRNLKSVLSAFLQSD